MKFLATLYAFAAIAMAETAQISMIATGPFTIGQSVTLNWTSGNSMPVSLSIVNSTWSLEIFHEMALMSQPYIWTVSDYAGFASGDYQLSLTQIQGGTSFSNAFKILVSSGTNMTVALVSMPVAAPTITYVYWDEASGCSKTSVGTIPMNTGLVHSASIWWDDRCSCHKTAMVPTSLPSSNNYTVPAIPPPMTTIMPAQNAASTTMRNTPSANFTGEAVKMQGSFFGIVAIAAAVAVC